MAVTRTCPVLRADVLFEQSCLVCPASKDGICGVIAGTIKAVAVDGVVLTEAMQQQIYVTGGK